MYTKLADQFETLVAQALEQHGYTADEVPIEQPPSDVDAAVASPVAFQLDAENPAKAARELAAGITTTDTMLSAVVAQGPYLNGIPAPSYYEETVETLTTGSIETADPMDVVVEHTSANPTGPLHIGSARNALIGNAIASAYEALGHNVTTQYYVNDVGLQVATLVWAYQAYGDDTDALDGDTLLQYYSTANEELDKDALRDAVQGNAVDGTPEAAVAETLSAIENGDEDVRSQLKTVVDTMRSNQFASLARLGIAVDEVVYESTFLDDGSVDAVIDTLTKTDHIKEQDGALMVDTSAGELVLTRSGGTSVYAARDIAFHQQKLASYDSVITVLGEDHEQHAKQLKATLEYLGAPTEFFTTVHHAFVDTPEGAMAKREGTAVYIDDVLDALEQEVAALIAERESVALDDEGAVVEEVASGAMAYGLLSKRPSKGITFDIEKAVDLDAATGPAIQYGYTRAHSILSGETVPTSGIDGGDLSEEESALVEQLGLFQPAIEAAAYDAEPHTLASYMHDLLDTFNTFYHSCPVLSAEEAVRETRLQLVAATEAALGTAFSILSMPTTTEM